MNRKLKKFARFIIDLPFCILGFLIIPLNILSYRIYNFFQPKRKPRLIFGATPIISIAYISRSLKMAGYQSHVVVLAESSIYSRDEFDVVLCPRFKSPQILNVFCGHALAFTFFLKSIWMYDIFHLYFDGGFLRNGFWGNFELILLKLAGKKIILMPYGSDSFVYDHIPNPIWRHALMLEYSHYGKEAKRIEDSIRRQVKLADIVIGCLVHYINLPKWDLLPLTYYPVDLVKIRPSYPSELHHGRQIKIAHACNHRGIKGTIFLIDAVNKLKNAGINVELDIIEKVSNKEALSRISKCDIYVDQLVFGFAQAALEAMAAGKVVISAVDDSNDYEIFRQYSYLNECPIISANIKNIYEVLLYLVHVNIDLKGIGKKNRQYVETRHSFESCASMFDAIYQKIWFSKNIDLINFYHPLLEKK